MTTATLSPPATTSDLSASMYVPPGWQVVTCTAADTIRRDPHVVLSGERTDLSGEFGEPASYRQWSSTVHHTPVLREYVWPHEPHRGCVHFTPGAAT